MSGSPLPGGVVTLLLGDIEGSVRGWESAPESMTVAARRFDELVSKVCAEFAGSRPVEQGEGDSFVAAFPRASDAVVAAVSLQVALLTEPWPGELDLRVRMAIHTGEIEFRDEGNYAGPTINRCARLRALARGGQVLVSGASKELLSDARLPRVTLQDLGQHELRDMRAEHVFQLCHPDIPSRFPPLPGSAEVVGAPAEVTSFVGRHSDIDDLEMRLAQSRVVTLTGAAGCGKSRLAARVAARCAPRQPDGAWWVSLADVTDGSVARAVANALGVSWLSTQDPADAIVSHLTGTAMLVVLDNCEHVLGPSVELIERVLQRCPDVRFLATSREQLGVYGEASWRVPSLSVPATDATDLDAIRAHGAVQLFVDRARQVRPNFELTAHSAPLIAEICRRVDGIPLAVELTAAQARLLGLEQIVAGLRDRFLLLGVSARGNTARQRTLQASVDWSYALLDDDERALLRRLGVFSGGFTLDSAEAVCSGDGIEPRQVLDLLSRLVDKSLVQAEIDDDAARYTLLESIREYARSKLVDAGEASLVQDRHLSWIIELGEAIEPGINTTDRARLLDTLEAELGNVRAALAWAVDSGAVDNAMRLVAAMWSLWITRVPPAQGLAILDEVIALPGGAPELRAAVTLWHANVVLLIGDVEQGLTGSMRAVELAREVGDTFLLRVGLSNVGWCLLFAAPDEARAAFEEASAIANDGPTNALAESRSALAWLEALAGDFDAADRHLAEAEVIARQTCDESALEYALLFKGGADLLRARSTCHEYLRESLVNGTRLGDGLFVPIIWSVRAWAMTLRGDYSGAEVAGDNAQRIARDGGSEFAVAHVNGSCGIAECRRGRWQLAAALSESASKWFGQWGSNWYSRRFGIECARARYFEGAADEAAERLATIRAEAEHSGDQLNLSLACLVAAETALDADVARAEIAAHEALTIAEDRSLTGTMIDCVDLLACAAVERGEAAVGARLLGAVDAIRATQNYCRSVPETERDAHYRGVARDALGDEEFSSALADGGGLDLAALLSYVRRGRGGRKRPTTGWDSLTPAELEVVALVATGSSNAEAAAKLFVAPGTVKAHLAHIYAKLGVGSRTALAAAFSRRGD